MKSRWLSGLLFGVAIACAPAVFAEDKVADAEYFPLKVGTTWEYKAGGQTITVRVAKHEKIDNVPCALLETVVNGNVITTEHISADKDGVYRHSLGGQKAEPAVKFVKLPIKKGESWKVESKLMGQELKANFKEGEDQVKVPAGTYKNALTVSGDMEAMGQKMDLTQWYAKGIGMVKTVITVGGNKIEMELDKFTPGK